MRSYTTSVRQGKTACTPTSLCSCASGTKQMGEQPGHVLKRILFLALALVKLPANGRWPHFPGAPYVGCCGICCTPFIFGRSLTACRRPKGIRALLSKSTSYPKPGEKKTKKTKTSLVGPMAEVFGRALWLRLSPRVRRAGRLPQHVRSLSNLNWGEYLLLPEFLDFSSFLSLDHFSGKQKLWISFAGQPAREVKPREVCKPCVSNLGMCAYRVDRTFWDGRRVKIFALFNIAYPPTDQHLGPYFWRRVPY